jgi:hypothetical protein
VVPDASTTFPDVFNTIVTMSCIAFVSAGSGTLHAFTSCRNRLKRNSE